MSFLKRISERHGRQQLTKPPNRAAAENPISIPPLSRTLLKDYFVIEAEKVAAQVTEVTTVDDVSVALRHILEGYPNRRIVTWERSVFDQWNIGWLWDEQDALSIDESAENARDACLNADIGITLADFAVAETGSLILCTSPKSSRSVSLTPTIHIALVKSSDIVAIAEDAFWAISQRDLMPSSLHFISGPSRSADIENDLSIGVHGPAALHIILLNDLN